MAKNLVLAIDPGQFESGFVVWDGIKCLEGGITPNQEVLSRLATNSYPVACEMIASYGMAVGKSIFETCLWIGRFMQMAITHKQEWNFIFRQEAKLHLCMSPRAKDSNIRQALVDRFGEPGTKNNPGPLFGVRSHVWAALAVAVTFHDKKYATRIYP
jgi:hypothetical protein